MEKFNLKKKNPNYLKILNAQKALFTKEEPEEVDNSNENHLITLMKKKLTSKHNSSSSQGSKSDLSAELEDREDLEDAVSKQKGNLVPLTKIRSSLHVENPKEKNFINELTKKFERKKSEMVSIVQKVSAKPNNNVIKVKENKKINQKSSVLLPRTMSYNVIRSPAKNLFDLKKKNINFDESDKFSISSSSKNTSNNEIENPETNISPRPSMINVGSPVKFTRTNFLQKGLTIKEEEGLNLTKKKDNNLILGFRLRFLL